MARFTTKLYVLLAAVAWASPDASKVAEVEAKIAATRSSLLKIFGEGLDPSHTFDAAHMRVGVEFFDVGAGRSAVVERFVRAFALGDSFVIAVGGMSDVAGHGNLFDEAYPNVCGDSLRPLMEEAGIRFQVRNMAMGGVPSFPNSVCMGDNFGHDADVIVWDFRMVERDEVKGELYVRQALMQPRSPFIMFKRKNSYLNKLKYAHAPGGLHVIDEMQAYNALKKLNSPGVANDKFCEAACECPGQVRCFVGNKRFNRPPPGAFPNESSKKISPVVERSGNEDERSKNRGKRVRFERYGGVGSYPRPAWTGV